MRDLSPTQIPVQASTGHLPLRLVIRAERLAARLRQFDVARELGISESAYSRYESGRTPLDEETAARIREAFKTA